MAPEDRDRLEKVVTEVQRHWGPVALRRLGEAGVAVEVPHIPTGFFELDQALGIGGIPRGRVTEILGTPTCGMGTLALKIIASAQAAGSPTVLVDLEGTFDAEYAAHVGVDLETLVLVRPKSGIEGLAITDRLVTSGGIGVLIFDSISHLLSEPGGNQALSSALRQLTSVLAGSPCALLVLSPLPPGTAFSSDEYPSRRALPHAAAVRLVFERERWLWSRRDVRGYEVRASVVKNKLGPAGQEASIVVDFW